jgi:hypothetical protein
MCDDLVWNTNCHLNPFKARLGGISKKDHGVVLFLYLKVTKLMVGCDDHILPMNMSLQKQKMVLAPSSKETSSLMKSLVMTIENN